MIDSALHTVRFKPLVWPQAQKYSKLVYGVASYIRANVFYGTYTISFDENGDTVEWEFHNRLTRESHDCNDLETAKREIDEHHRSLIMSTLICQE